MLPARVASTRQANDPEGTAVSYPPPNKGGSHSATMVALRCRWQSHPWYSCNAFIAIAIWFVGTVSVFGQGFRPSSLNLEAHETGTGVSTQTKWQDDYGGYDRDYRQRKKIIVTVRDLSRKAPRL